MEGLRLYRLEGNIRIGDATYIDIDRSQNAIVATTGRRRTHDTLAGHGNDDEVIPVNPTAVAALGGSGAFFINGLMIPLTIEQLRNP